jgi:UDP-glucose-4-epimerase GalE
VKVLVTGGAGYIGSHAVRELLDSGHEAVVLDDLSAGHREALPKAVTLVQGDIGDPSVVARALDGCSCVLHFAGLLSVGASVRDPASYYRTNVAKGLTLLEGVVASGVRRFIFSSTCAVYGIPKAVPIDEGHPLDPINPYGASKKAFERALHDYAHAGLVEGVSLRYFNAAGCHASGGLGEDHAPEEHLIPLAIDAALGRRPKLTLFGEDYDTPDGTCIRDYIHVQDLARAHVLALDVPVSPFRVFNLGTAQGNSVRQVVETVGRIGGKPVPVEIGPRRAGDPPRLVAQAGRAEAELHFKTRFGLEEIVESAWRWRQSHPQGYRG